MMISSDGQNPQPVMSNCEKDFCGPDSGNNYERKARINPIDRKWTHSSI
jgi:hypothetical protein